MSSDEEGAFEDGKTKAKILDTLAKYGDSLLDDDAYQAKSKKRKKRKSDSIITEQTTPSTIKTKRRKKKKKKIANSESGVGRDDKDGSDSEDFDEGDEKSQELHGEQRHLAQLKQKLGLTDLDFLQTMSRKKKAESKAESDRSKGKSDVRGKRPPPEVIVFEDPAKRNKNKDKKPIPIKRLRRTSSGGSDSESEDEDGGERPPPRDPNLFDMRTAKHDVHMLGIAGMEKNDKERAKMDLLLKLGAKPPKKAVVNYKQLQVMKKKEKEDFEAQRELERAVGNKISKANNRKKRQRDQNDIGPVDGQVGRYKSGVQVLNKQEIHRIKSARGRRRR